MIRAEVALPNTTRWRPAFRGDPEFSTIERACAALSKAHAKGAYPGGSQFRVLRIAPPFRAMSRPWRPGMDRWENERLSRRERAARGLL